MQVLAGLLAQTGSSLREDGVAQSTVQAGLVTAAQPLAGSAQQHRVPLYSERAADLPTHARRVTSVGPRRTLTVGNLTSTERLPSDSDLLPLAGSQER